MHLRKSSVPLVICHDWSDLQMTIHLVFVKSSENIASNNIVGCIFKLQGRLFKMTKEKARGDFLRLIKLSYLNLQQSVATI